MPQADILPFPARAAAGPSPLVVSLAKLLAALDEQKAAVAEWRANLGDLKQSVDQLGRSMGDYRFNLATLSIGVEQVNRNARTLENICTTAL